MQCPMCKSDVEAFVKSHIVPEAIATANVKRDQFLMAASCAGHPKRLRTGAYSRIVCHDCEQSFKRDDDYLIAAFRSLARAVPVFEGRGSRLDEVEPLRLQRSILTVLYRAHLSDHDLYQAVKLGPHAEPLTIFLRSSDMVAPAAFSAVLRHLTDKLASAMLNPVRENLGGVNVYRLFIPSLTAIVKVDQKPFNPDFRDCQLTHGQPVIAMRFDRLTPSEDRLLRRFASQHGPALSNAFARRK